MCQRVKATTKAKTKPLHPHDIPERPWATISVDFIGPLPLSRSYDMIMVVIDKFTKMMIAIPCNKEVDTKGTAQMFKDHIWNRFGLLSKVISNRGPQFATEFSRELNKALSIITNISTVYHPQTDGQTEQVNQEIKQYL